MYIRAITVDPPQYLNPMSPASLWGRPIQYYWKTRWDTDATTGYIVQEIYTTYDQTDASGTTRPTHYGRYFEAWQITGPGNAFAPNPFDYWSFQIGLGTRGTWTKVGVAFWVAALEPEAGFRSGGATGAGSLLSTSTQPRNLGNGLLRRVVRGEWDATSAPTVALCHHREPTGNAVVAAPATAAHAAAPTQGSHRARAVQVAATAR